MNLEAGVFLRNLRAYSNRQSVYINDKTVALLSDIVSYIDELVHKANMFGIQHENNIEFLDDLDERHYELRRNIMCRLCIVS